MRGEREKEKREREKEVGRPCEARARVGGMKKNPRGSLVKREFFQLAPLQAMPCGHPGRRHQNQAGVLYACLLALAGGRLRNGELTAGLGAVTKKEGRRKKKMIAL